MIDIAIILTGTILTYAIYNLLNNIKKVQKKINITKKKSEDLSIEFGAQEGTGIELVKKNYGEIVDDWREHLEHKEPHSTSEHMNDPSDVQKYAFDKETKTCVNCKHSEPMHANRWCNLHNGTYQAWETCNDWDK